jgi:hypothetical protein
MADFDHSSDAALGAACNRLAAWVEPLPEGHVIDAASGLTERDLALILRHLHATRHSASPDGPPTAPETLPPSRPSVPVTARH